MFFEQGQNAAVRIEEIVSEIKADLSSTPNRIKNKPPIFEISRVVENIVAEKKLIAGSTEIELISTTNGEPVYCELPAA